jgi:imidazolonepropionase-like amidohydrolase
VSALVPRAARALCLAFGAFGSLIAAQRPAVPAGSVASAPARTAPEPLALRIGTLYTLAHADPAAAIQDALVLVEHGKLRAIGRAAELAVPTGWRVIEAPVATPGLIDAHSAVGLAGWLNGPHDREELEASAPIQPELAALDAFNPREPLLDWLRSLGVTTIHTGHAPGALISGQTLIAKTWTGPLERSIVQPRAMLAATLGEGALGGKGPGTRAKALALLRAELVRARELQQKRARTEGEPPARDLRLEVLIDALEGKLPLLVTAQRAHDIDAALRIAREFGLRIVLDGAAEIGLRIDEVRAAGVPVFLHPTMQRAVGECENLSMETAALLERAGIPFAIQGGYESYAPRTRVALFEAAIACKQGLPFGAALAAITIRPARLLGIEQRVGSLEVGKDADLALFDGDPFETTSHCLGVVIEGVHEAGRR